MDFQFDADQDALRATVRSFLDDLAAAGTLRAMHGDAAVSDDVWRSIVDLGWTALLIPEEDGGLGLGLVDLVVVVEELGKRCFAGPYVSNSLATIALRHLGETDRLALVAERGWRGTIALDELGHGDPVERIRTRARRRGTTWQLTGLKPIVLDAVGADGVVVAARTEAGIGTFLVELATLEQLAEPVPTIDPARHCARLDLDATPAVPIGPDGDHTAIWRRIADDAAVVVSAELTGVCDAAIEMAVAYAKDRVQFDVPLSSHQAIQHKLVDMLHATEMGRVGVHYAAWCSDTDHPDRRTAASIAKSSMAEAAVMVTSENIQVHGAVGFTWDSDAQLLYKRAKQNDLLFGAQGWHRRRIAEAVLSST